MASFESAKPIYTLLDELGGPEEASNFVLQNLIKYMKGDDIRDFVNYFRRNHSMNEDIVRTHFDEVNIDDETEDYESNISNDYYLCLDCQDSYDIDKPHVCATSGDTVKSKFSGCRIPEC